MKTLGTFLSRVSILGYSGIPGLSHAVETGELRSLDLQGLSLSCVLKIKVDSDLQLFLSKYHLSASRLM